MKKNNTINNLYIIILIVCIMVSSIRQVQRIVGWNLSFIFLSSISFLLPLLFLIFITLKKDIITKAYQLKLVLIYFISYLSINVVSYIWLNLINIKINFFDLCITHFFDNDFLKDKPSLLDNNLNGIIVGLLELRFYFFTGLIVLLIVLLYKKIKRKSN